MLIGLSRLQMLICSRCMADARISKPHSRLWDLIAADCPRSVTQVIVIHHHLMRKITQKALADRMRALMSREAPPNIGSSHAPPQSSGVSSQPPSASGVTRTMTTSAVQQLRNEDGTVFQLPPTPVHCEYRTAIPVSRQAARDAFLAMEHNANGYTIGEWYVW